MSSPYPRAAFTKWTIMAVSLAVLFVPGVRAFCPSQCQCDGDTNLRALCISAELDVVPIQLNPDVKTINLAKNKITKVDYSMAFYNKLEYLNLTENKVDTLGSKNLEYQTELKVLDVSQNVIQSLAKDAFKGLKSLKRLLLNDNQIETIHQNALLDMHNLIELNLNNNKLMSFEDKTFRHLANLRVLLLENNQLLEVPSNENLIFLTKLVFLNLKRNLIEQIRNNSFTGLSNLVSLQLNDNVINDVEMDAFIGMNALNGLDLADNNLTTLPTLSLSKLSNLTNLSLSGNRFSHLPAVAFLNLFQLRVLHLDRLENLIRIDQRAFVDNTFLVKLAVNNNPQFNDLPPRLFHGNPNLIDISMKGNALTTLDAAQFPLDRLHRIQLSNNPFVCNCSLLWLWRLIREQQQSSNEPTLSRQGMDNEVVGVDLTMGEDQWADHLDVMHEAMSQDSLVIMDRNDIGCDVVVKGSGAHSVRRQLLNLRETDIECPAHMITIICAIMTVFVVLMTGLSVLLYLQFIKRRKKILEERKNVNERIVPQQIDKMELERYLAEHQHQQQSTSIPLTTSSQQQAILSNMFPPYIHNTHHNHQIPQTQQTNLNEYHQHKPILPSWDIAQLPVQPPPPLPKIKNFDTNPKKISKIQNTNFNTTKSQFSTQKKYNYLQHCQQQYQKHNYQQEPQENEDFPPTHSSTLHSSSNKKFIFSNCPSNQHENLINDTDTDHYEQFEYFDCRPSRLQQPTPSTTTTTSSGSKSTASSSTVNNGQQPHVVYV